MCSSSCKVGNGIFQHISAKEKVRHDVLNLTDKGFGMGGAIVR